MWLRPTESELLEFYRLYWGRIENAFCDLVFILSPNSHNLIEMESQPKLIWAHSLLLASLSPLIKSQLRDQRCTCNAQACLNKRPQIEIVLSETKESTVRDLLHLVYRGQVHLGLRGRRELRRLLKDLGCDLDSVITENFNQTHENQPIESSNVAQDPRNDSRNISSSQQTMPNKTGFSESIDSNSSNQTVTSTSNSSCEANNGPSTSSTNHHKKGSRNLQGSSAKSASKHANKSANISSSNNPSVVVDPLPIPRRESESILEKSAKKKLGEGKSHLVDKKRNRVEQNLRAVNTCSQLKAAEELGATAEESKPGSSNDGESVQCPRCSKVLKKGGMGRLSHLISHFSLELKEKIEDSGNCRVIKMSKCFLCQKRFKHPPSSHKERKGFILYERYVHFVTEHAYAHEWITDEDSVLMAPRNGRGAPKSPKKAKRLALKSKFKKKLPKKGPFKDVLKCLRCQKSVKGSRAGFCVHVTKHLEPQIKAKVDEMGHGPIEEMTHCFLCDIPFNETGSGVQGRIRHFAFCHQIGHAFMKEKERLVFAQLDRQKSMRKVQKRQELKRQLELDDENNEVGPARKRERLLLKYNTSTATAQVICDKEDRHTHNNDTNEGKKNEEDLGRLNLEELDIEEEEDEENPTFEEQGKEILDNTINCSHEISQDLPNQMEEGEEQDRLFFKKVLAMRRRDLTEILCSLTNQQESCSSSGLVIRDAWSLCEEQ